MAREVPEWIGKTDDSKVPLRVRLRCFLAHNGRCHLCDRQIRLGDDWELDHKIALINGGGHREKNLAPICDFCHPTKTAKDVAEKSDTYKARLKHYGLKESKSPMPYGRKSRWKRKLNGQIVPRE